MSTAPTFKFMVEYTVHDVTAVARFTNEKHAKNFYRSQKKEDVRNLKMFSIDENGTIVKEIKTR